MKLFREKKLLFLVILLIAILLAVSVFLAIKTKQNKSSKLEGYIPVGEAKENFKPLQNNPALSGKFSSYDEIKSEIYILFFDTNTMKVLPNPFKINGHTIFSKTTIEFDQSKLFPAEKLKDIPMGTQVIVYYSDSEDQAGPPVAKLIMVEDFSQPLSP
jgi:hypothetical protein